MPIDVTSLYDRRSDNRWDRICVGDILERVTWSRPDRIALAGWAGAFGEPAFERLTYRQASDAVNRFANGPLARGLIRGDRVLLTGSPRPGPTSPSMGTASGRSCSPPARPRSPRA